MALIIFALTLIAFFSCFKLIVEIKLIMVWDDLNLSFLIIFSPTVGVTDKKIHSLVSIISWLLFAIFILLNLFFNFLDISLFLEDIIIFLKVIFDLKIPVITEDAIFPDPINPMFITLLVVTKLNYLAINKNGR